MQLNLLMKKLKDKLINRLKQILFIFVVQHGRIQCIALGSCEILRAIRSKTHKQSIFSISASVEYVTQTALAEGSWRLCLVAPWSVDRMMATSGLHRMYCVLLIEMDLDSRKLKVFWGSIFKCF